MVALGGGHGISRNYLLGLSLGSAGSRVLTAVELVRRGKASTLVLGGCGAQPGEPGPLFSARVQDWLAAWRLTPGSVTNLGLCRDTHDEALRFRQLQDEHRWQRVILVTSALHLRRSVAVLAKAGVPVIPVAADFQVAGIALLSDGFSPFPRQQRFELLALYLHERIGEWVYRWRGWT